MESTRPSWSDTWMGVAEIMSRRATCPRLHTAAVIVSRDNRLLSTGYNGSPEGSPHCENAGCILEDNHCIRAVHAELNAILYAARRGIEIEGTAMFILHAPCVRCAICIAQSGIHEVYYLNEYGSTAGVGRLNALNVHAMRI